MTPLQSVDLLTRPFGAGDAEMVVAVRIGDQIVDLPEGAPVEVRYEAGEGIAVVAVELYAGKVRYVPEGDVR